MDRNTRRLHIELNSSTDDNRFSVPKFWLALCLMLCLLLAGLPLRAQAAQLSPFAQRVLYTASQNMEKKEFAKAAESLQKYLDEHDGKAEEQFYILLGNCRLEMEDIKQAYATFSKGVAAHPDSYPLQYNLGVAAYGQDKLAIAAKAFEDAYALQQKDTKKYGDTPVLLYQAAACRFRIKDYNTALDRLNQLLTRPDVRKNGPKPNWVKLRVNLLCQLKRWKEAETALTSLLKSSPDLADYWELLAQVQINREKHASAAAALETAYAIKPPSASKWQSLANLYLYINAPLQAARCLQKGAPHDLAKRLGSIYSRSNRYEEALAACDKLVQSANCADPLLLKARIQMESGHSAESMQTYAQAAETRVCPADKNTKKTRTKKSIQGEAYTMAALAAWDVKDWPAALRYFSLAENTVAPYAKQAKYGHAMVQDILDAEKFDPDRVPTIK
ncbi:MAG: tetratricopeptide repeat protein [Desulfovibrio sp.]|uniref:tetratricopeptide repeat protein n=1 Tax=Desulfovibrio sp. 7SRBS1 TaxID=3378064 RepID=UPI003B402A31